MHHPRCFAAFSALVFVCALACAAAATAAPKSEDWIDTQGAKFRGAPSELIGPFAIFRTGASTGRRVPLTLLKPGDCVRFAEALQSQPPRAADWAGAKGAISGDLSGNVLRVENGKLVPADLRGRAEPQFFILFVVRHSIGPSWEMMGASMEKYAEIQKRFPGQVEAVMVGHGHSRGDHVKMATGMNVPWLVTDLMSQAGMPAVLRHATGEPPFLAIVTREGVPLLSSVADTKAKVAQTLAGFVELLEAVQPGNPRSWAPREHYFRAVQPAAHRTGRAAPVLVGDPLKPDALQANGIERFEAVLQVTADGKVLDVVMQPGAKMPDAFVDPVRLALAQAVLVPAVAEGKFVAGELPYRFPPAP